MGHALNEPFTLLEDILILHDDIVHCCGVKHIQYPALGAVSTTIGRHMRSTRTHSKRARELDNARIRVGKVTDETPSIEIRQYFVMP